MIVLCGGLHEVIIRQEYRQEAMLRSAGSRNMFDHLKVAQLKEKHELKCVLSLEGCHGFTLPSDSLFQQGNEIR